MRWLVFSLSLACLALCGVAIKRLNRTVATAEMTAGQTKLVKITLWLAVVLAATMAFIYGMLDFIRYALV